MDRLDKGFSTVVVLIIVGVLIIAMIVGIIAMSKKSSSKISPAAQSENNGVPSMKTTDMASHVPFSQKTTLIVEHSDSSFEKFLLPSDAVTGFIMALPKGDKVVGTTPPAK